jgi:hypothetical protein
MTSSPRVHFALAALLFSATCAPFSQAADGPQHLRDFQRVVVAADALPVTKTAAAELARYAGLIAGHELSVVPLDKFSRESPGLTFFVGEAAGAQALGHPLAPWKREEWTLHSIPAGLVLAGHDGPGDAWSMSVAGGSMLAVYTLLEDHLGVRWFWPGEFGEHVPANAEAVIAALDVRRQPVFEIRSVSTGYAPYHNKTFHEESRKWARRSRLGWVRSAVFGHSWNDAFNLRNDTSFKEHPEWFALVKGVRKPPQMCTTNPEVIARMVEFVLAGKADIMNISPSDGGGFCECERCRALDVPGLLAYDNKTVQLSDRIFTYANEVARRVRERNPEKGCGMFAYTFYNKPPVKIPKLEPNLYLSFVYQSAAHRDPENLREWRESVAGWQKLGAKMVVREGWGNHYYFDLPFLHDRQITDNLAEAHKLGFVAAYGDGSKNFATVAPNNWAITHAMWDPQRDATALMRDFYDSAYGPVAREMEAFFASYTKALDAHWAERDRNVDATGIAYANVIGAWGRLIPPAAVEEAEQHLREAEKKAPPGEYADRVRFHRFGQDYTRTMLDLLATYRELAVLGMHLDSFSAVAHERRTDPAAREKALRHAFELGEERERHLLAHRDWSGPDEGLYGFANDAGLRRWHAEVKTALGIDKPSAVTKAVLAK